MKVWKHSQPKGTPGLETCDSQDILRRLSDAAAKVVSTLQANLNTGEATEVLTGPGDLQDRMLKYEKALIKQALAQVNGSVYFLPSRSYPVTDHLNNGSFK